MAKITVNGHEIDAIFIKDSFSRRATQFKNNIITVLGKIGLTADDVDINLEPNAAKNISASASWYFNNHHLHYSYGSRSKYVENLYVVSKVIEMEVNSLINGEKTVHEFIIQFSEDVDVAKQRKEARTILGLEENEKNIEIIDKAYKELAKENHPDTQKGSIEKFKEINRAHKILKKELT